MVRLCERPGCSLPADVSYGFDAEQLVVWLDAFQAAHGATSGVLCRRHADAMVVPLSWMLDDRRDPAPRLFRSPAEPSSGPMIRPRARRARPDRAVQLRLDTPADEAADLVTTGATATTAAESHVAAAGDAPGGDDATAALPWQPVFDERDDLQGLLKARGRLLSRAFNGIASDNS